MNTNKIRSSLNEKKGNLEKFKIQVSNFHIKYLTNYEVDSKNISRIGQPNLIDEEQEKLEETSIYMSIDCATAVLSDVGLDLNTDDIIEKYYDEENEYYNLYSYKTIWGKMVDLDPESFFIAVLSLVINIGDHSNLGVFYKNEIVKLFKDNEFEGLYNDVINNNTVFIAMWFDDTMQLAYGKIEKAISECGYKPVRIDQKEHNNQIVPEIFHEIKNSVFVVADLTGQRNGVYYEAGYAEALKKNVIMTCKGEPKDCHFDVAQKNIIFWNNPNELYERLLNRIKATCSAS